MRKIKPVNRTLSLPEDIMEYFSDWGRDALIEFLRVAPKLIEKYAEFDEKALVYIDATEHLKYVDLFKVE